MMLMKAVLSRFRLVYRKSPLVLKCAVLVSIVLSIVALTSLRIGIVQYRENTQWLRQQAADALQRQQVLRTQIDELGTVQSVKRIATEELDLVDPDTIFFDVD